jgi:hemerythrin superfamily protein
MKGMQEIVGQVESFFEIDTTSAVGLLKADHRKVDKLFKEFEGAKTTSSKQKLMDEIVKELTVHASIEEDLVYPLLETQEGKTAERTQEANEEHHLLKVALAELADTPASSKQAKPKVKVISELVKHHVKEEESQLLPKLESSGVDLKVLAEQMRERKQQLMGGIARGGGIGKNKDRKAQSTTSRKPMAKVGKSGTKKSMSRSKSVAARPRKKAG